MSVDFSNEFRLLAACCRWPRSPESNEAMSAALPVDWNRFLALVRRHRVPALAYGGLIGAGIDMPSDVRGTLAAESRIASFKSLAVAHENLRLQGALDERSVPHLSVKGASLAMLAYGEPGIKHSRDIDLLVPPAYAAETFAVLEDMGYEARTKPASGSPDGAALPLDQTMDLLKEQSFLRPGHDLLVEVHWRLFDNRLMLNGLDAFEQPQSVPLAGRSIRTMGDGRLFAYLVAHGARHGWSRLKWIADVAAFLSRREDTGVERLYAEAERVSAQRMAGAALLLCERLFEMRFPEAVMTRVRRDRHVRRLETTSIALLTFEGPVETIDFNSALWWSLARARFSFVPGFRFRFAELRQYLDSHADRANIRLPRGLGFLYPVLRIPLIVGRFVKRRFFRSATT